jgi:hypothetical protein
MHLCLCVVLKHFVERSDRAPLPVAPEPLGRQVEHLLIDAVSYLMY